MRGNLSIPSKLLALLAVPVAGAALLGVSGLAAAVGGGQAAGRAGHRGGRDRPRGAGRPAAAGGPGAARRPGRRGRLAHRRPGVDGRLVPPERVVEDLDALVAALFGAIRGLAGRLEAPATARTARLLLAVVAAKEATGQERALLAPTPPPAGRGLRARAGEAPEQALRLRLAAQERRLRGQLALAGGLALVTLAAALLGRARGGRDRRAAATGGRRRR